MNTEAIKALIEYCRSERHFPFSSNEPVVADDYDDIYTGGDPRQSDKFLSLLKAAEIEVAEIKSSITYVSTIWAGDK